MSDRCGRGMIGRDEEEISASCTEAAQDTNNLCNGSTELCFLRLMSDFWFHFIPSLFGKVIDILH